MIVGIIDIHANAFPIRVAKMNARRISWYDTSDYAAWYKCGGRKVTSDTDQKHVKHLYRVMRGGSWGNNMHAQLCHRVILMGSHWFLLSPVVTLAVLSALLSSKTPIIPQSCVIRQVMLQACV